MRTDQPAMLMRRQPQGSAPRKMTQGQTNEPTKSFSKALEKEVAPEPETAEPEILEEPAEVDVSELASKLSNDEEQSGGGQAEPEAILLDPETDPETELELAPAEGLEGAANAVLPTQPERPVGLVQAEGEEGAAMAAGQEPLPALISDWQRALAPTEQAVEASAPATPTVDAQAMPAAWAQRPAPIVLGEAFTPVDMPTLDLSQPQAADRLFEAAKVQLRSIQSSPASQQLTLLLRPQGLGMMRLELQQKDNQISLRVLVDKAEAAQALEQLLPQLEARIAAQTALPVEAELIRQDLSNEEFDGQFGDMAEQFSEGGGDQRSSQGDEQAVVDAWRGALENPVLDGGQTLHVVA